METNTKIQVTVLFDVNAKGAKELEDMDHLNDEGKRECMAKAMEGVVAKIINKYFRNDERVEVTYVGAEHTP